MGLREMACCGVAEMAHIGGYQPSEAILQVCRESGYNKGYHTFYRPPNRKFLVFTQAGARAKYGNALKTYIEAQKLGDVTVSTKGNNPNTRRQITVYVWNVDRPALSRWLEANKPVSVTASVTASVTTGGPL